jgi:ribosome recycling factor
LERKHFDRALRSAFEGAIVPGWRPRKAGVISATPGVSTMTDDVLKELGTSIEKAHDALKRELGKLRTGRAHAGMLDGIRVDYYGTPTPIGQMATVAVPEARMLTVKPWDKGSLSLIEKAIRESNLGLNPQNDGELIRVPVPPLSEERRRDLVKIAKKAGEECKVAIRKARHEAIDMLNEFKKDGELSEDETERGKKRVEEVVSTGSGWVDTHIQAKEKEILQV